MGFVSIWVFLIIILAVLEVFNSFILTLMYFNQPVKMWSIHKVTKSTQVQVNGLLERFT